MSGRQLLYGNQRFAGLFRHLHDAFVSIFIHISQIHIRKFNARHDLELLLYAAATLNGILQQPPRLFAGDLLIREEQLDQSGHGLPDGDFIALVELSVQLEVFVKDVRKVHLAHAARKLCQAVRNQAIAFRQQFGAHLGNLPAREIVVHAVKKRAVVVELRRERAEQMGHLEQILHAVIDISHEHHGCIRVDHVPPTGE